jgi:hypothetical protein
VAGIDAMHAIKRRIFISTLAMAKVQPDNA